MDFSTFPNLSNHFVQNLEDNIKNPDAILKISSEMIDMGYLNESEDICISILNQNEENEEAFRQLGRIYTLRDQEIEAQIFFEKASKLKKNRIINISDSPFRNISNIKEQRHSFVKRNEDDWFDKLLFYYANNYSISLSEALSTSVLAKIRGISQDPLCFRINDLINSEVISSKFVKYFLSGRELSPWSLAPGTLQYLDEKLNSNCRILEFGSGASTEFLALKLSKVLNANNQDIKIISIEQDKNYVIETNLKLSQKELSNYAKVIHAPLIEIEFKGLKFNIYDIRENIDLLSKFNPNFIIIDGPSGGGYNRWGSMILASFLCEKNACWILDDALRETELNILKISQLNKISTSKIWFKGKGIAEGVFTGNERIIDNISELYNSSLIITQGSKNNIQKMNEICTWSKIRSLEKIKLYAGDIPNREEYKELIGLSLTNNDENHVIQDITRPFELPDNSIVSFQAEDVFEHIEYNKLIDVINEIYRILKPGGLFRLSVPDYGCDILKERSNKDINGSVIFDPYGGGTIENPGHLWFPTYDNVKLLIEKTRFSKKGKVVFYHYYDSNKGFVLKDIDYSLGYVQRTPDHDVRVQNPRRPLSIVVDLYKDEITDEITKKATDNKEEDLPIHFFTIVLNGRPFIEYHINIFNKLPFKWHWHIIEGVADLKHDTECHFIRGGRIPENFNINGLSVDGTSAYLDKLKQVYPQNVSIYRKNAGDYWDGKLEMVNAPIKNINEECLLWQIDVDEFWDIDKICKARELFLANPDKTAAFYYCLYFVGDGLYISSTNTYGNYTDYEWIRTWRYKPGCRWTSHAPPKLCVERDNTLINLSEINPLTHNETFENNLVFHHYAYTIPKQLEFKEKYYGYKDALKQWYRLQLVKSFPVYLRDYFDWVKDDAIVERVDNEEYKLKFILNEFEIELAEEITGYLGERNLIQDEKEKHLSIGDPTSVETRIIKILEENPFNSDALNDLSVINASRHNYELSIKLLNEAIKIFPDNETIRTNLETIKSFTSSQITSISINREDIISIKTKKYIDILEKKRSQGTNSGVKNELSFQLNFDFNDGCNLNCIMCGNVPNRTYKNQNIMDYSVFVNRFLPTIKYANTFQYGCFYEPLMVPYFIDSLWLMKEVIRPDAKGNIITNGTLLTSDKIKAIIDSDLFDKVRCSIDSVNPELFSRIRSGAKFEKVIHHLEELSAYRNNKGSKCKLELNFTIMRDNITELPELITLAKKLGIDSITTHKLAPTEIAYVDNDKLEIYSKSIKQAEEIAKELNISFSGQKYLSKTDYELIRNNKIEKSCGYFKRKFILLTIFANGNISTSCHRSGEILGNLNNENFEDIIHGSRFNTLKLAIEKSDPEICANCHMYQ